MKIQSAGRLGNNLFIWAFAYGNAIKLRKNISIFWDKYHSQIGPEERETATLLESEHVHFHQSNLLGMVLKSLDWVRRYSPRMYTWMCFALRIGTEAEGTHLRRIVIRGYFQDSKYVLENALSINKILIEALEEVAKKSVYLGEFQRRYSKYQLIHLRLGDYVGSGFGIIDSRSYEPYLDPHLPIIVCTNGTQDETERILNFKVDHVITPKESSTWETLVIFANSARFIGVNSTLSWWGAFLVSRKGLPAFLPEHWTINKDKNIGEKLRVEGVCTYDNTFMLNL